ncbi:MAG: hypothetical protein VB144_06640 [Clostridia bacterium]|nr:hypothetical protein [Clostridia bacterium]
MRIAVMVISLVLMAAIGLQAFTLYGLGAIVGPEEKGAGAAGLGVAFFYLLGGAFSLGVPVLSTIVLFIAGMYARWIAGKELYPDMYIWGWIAWTLAALELISIVKAKKRSTNKGVATS